jgi:molybdate transport system substrate-binding protein
MRLKLLGLILFLGLAGNGTDAPAATVKVFAAASLTDSLQEIARNYEAQTSDKIVFNLAASSTLARQIQEGAPADIFFSADEEQMNRLAAKGLVDVATRKSFLSNSLVIVVRTDFSAPLNSPQDLAGADVKRVALGDPQAVPIGVYAKAYLEELKLWKAIQPKVVATANVRAALAAVETGDADASIVYKTDAAISRKVRVAFTVPAGEGPKISYPAALVKDAPQPEAGKKFLEYLGSKAAAKIFRKFGFVVP